MKDKKVFSISVAVRSLNRYYDVAEADHMSATAFAATIISKFGDLKQGYALKALSAIPAEYFKAKPGRPARSEGAADDTLQNPPGMPVVR